MINSIVLLLSAPMPAGVVIVIVSPSERLLPIDNASAKVAASTPVGLALCIPAELKIVEAFDSDIKAPKK